MVRHHFLPTIVMYGNKGILESSTMKKEKVNAMEQNYLGRR